MAELVVTSTVILFILSIPNSLILDFVNANSLIPWGGSLIPESCPEFF